MVKLLLDDDEQLLDKNAVNLINTNRLKKMKGWTSRIAPQKTLTGWCLRNHHPCWWCFSAAKVSGAPKGRNHAPETTSSPLKNRPSWKEISNSTTSHLNLLLNFSERKSTRICRKKFIFPIIKHVHNKIYKIICSYFPLFLPNTPKNQPTEPTYRLPCFSWNQPMAMANGLPPRQKRGHVTPAQGGALCFLGCAFTRTMEIFISGSTASSFFDAAGVKLLCWEKIGLNVGHFHMSNLHVSRTSSRTRWLTAVVKVRQMSLHHLARICMSLWHLPLCISHFFQANYYIQPSNGVIPNAQLQRLFHEKNGLFHRDPSFMAY